MAQSRTQGSSGFQTLLTGHLGVGVRPQHSFCLVLSYNPGHTHFLYKDTTQSPPSAFTSWTIFYHEAYKVVSETLSSQAIPWVSCSILAVQWDVF